MKVGILTLGCKVNTYESEYVENTLREQGYEIGSFHDVCDIYIINTCTVTNTSDIKSRKMIRKAIKQNKDACIVVMGCFIQANQDFQEEGIDIIIGNKDKSKLVTLLDEYFNSKKQIKVVNKEPLDQFEDMYITNFPGRTRAFVKIQDGCENFCSYCIIPFVRGKCRSKEKDKVIKEIKELVGNGYKEVVLTGIHTGNYGVDIDTNFSELLKEIVKIKNLKRLRISSIEITELTDQVLQVIKDNNIIVDHLHIPLQSGSDQILKLMNRKYNVEDYIKKTKQIRKIRPDIAISTDVIVGFPGESEEMFNNTVKTCKKVGFSKIHVFPFSLRNKTEAQKLPDHLPISIKKERCRQLLLLSKQLEISYYKQFLHKKVEVLIEEDKEGYSYGHTSNFLAVKIKGKLEHNTLYQVELVEISYPYCIGK